MKIEKYLAVKAKALHFISTLSFLLAISAVSSGCRGTAPSLSQAFRGLSSPARVPPPAQGSFQVPGSYSGTVGSPANPASSGLGGSSFGDSAKTSQNTQPVSNLISSLSNAQSQILNATNSARNSVTRAADGIHSTVEQASARADRLGQGVVQAGEILSEAASLPVVGAPSDLPNSISSTNALPPVANSNSGRIGDNATTENASWRSPTAR